MMPTTSVGTNGVAHRLPQGMRTFEPRRVPQPTMTRPNSTSYSLADTGTTAPRLRQKVATLLLPVGTTAGGLARRLTGRLESVLGLDRQNWPGGFDCLFIDTLPPAAGGDSANTFVIPGGVHGAATVAAEGRNLFRKPPVAAALLSKINHCLSSLRSDDPRLPCGRAPSQSTQVVVITGFGGTGGGGQDEVVTIVHEAATRCQISELQVVVLAIGPEASILDANRCPLPMQAQTIRANAYAQLTRYADDFAADGIRTEERPNGTTVRMRRADRVWAVGYADRGNGVVTCQTLDELLDVQAEALFQQIFTQAGADFAEREIDPAGTKDDGRGDWRSK